MSKKTKAAAAEAIVMASAPSATIAERNATAHIGTGKKDVSAKITGTVLEVAFREGAPLVIDASLFSPELLMRAALHGLKQKCVDGAALPRDTSNGRSASIEQKFEAVREIVTRLTTTGEWNAATKEREPGGQLLKALMRVYPDKGAVRIAAWLEKKSDAEKTAMRREPAIAAALEAIRAEEGRTSGIDTRALLAELDD